MGILTIKTPFNIELKFKLASIIKRLLAWVVDLILLYIYTLIFKEILSMYNVGVSRLNSFNWNLVDNVSITIMLFVIMLPCFLYHLLLPYFWDGKTVGKYMMGIKVINNFGARNGLGALTLRWILFMPNFILLFLISFSGLNSILILMLILFVMALPDLVTMAITEKQQRLGDIAANTIVIEVNYKANINETFFKEFNTQDNYVVKYPNVILLSDKDVNGLLKLVKNAKNTNLTFLHEIAEKIASKTGIQNTELEYLPFFEILIADYNYLTQQK